MASDVQVNVMVHCSFELCGVSNFATCIEYGNVLEQSTLSLQLQRNKDVRLCDMPRTLPIQVQVRFTRTRDGMKVLRVFNESVVWSSDRASVESQINVAVFATAVIQSFANTHARFTISHPR